MKSSPSYQDYVKAAMAEYPTLYALDPMRVNDHLFVGNSEGWHTDGGVLPSPNHKPENPDVAKMLKNIFAALAKVPVVTQLRDRECLPSDCGLIWAFPKDQKEDEAKWLEFDFKESETPLEIDEISVLEYLTRPVKFSDLHIKAYSAAANTPKNIKPDYAEALLKTLLAVYLSGPNENYNAENQVNALILLLKLRPLLLKKCAKVPSIKKIIALKETHNARMLTLDIQRHAQNHKLDEALLSNDEFFELYRLTTPNLTDDQKSLIRRYVQFQTWKEDLAQKSRILQDKADYLAQKKFWRKAVITKDSLTAPLDEKVVADWAIKKQVFSTI